MAAHLEGKGASVLDFTGFAQKFGPVLSFIRLGAAPEAINQVRIDAAQRRRGHRLRRRGVVLAEGLGLLPAGHAGWC